MRYLKENDVKEPQETHIRLEYLEFIGEIRDYKFYGTMINHRDGTQYELKGMYPTNIIYGDYDDTCIYVDCDDCREITVTITYDKGLSEEGD